MASALANIEKSYDTVLKEYQDYYTQQYEKARVETDVMHQENLRRQAEIGQGLSTGQSVISEQASKLSKQQTENQLAETTEQAYSEAEINLQNAFSEQLTSLFGKIDENGRFSKLVEYSGYADLATDTMLNVAAKRMLNNASQEAIDLAKEKGYIDDTGGIIDATGYLQSQGILEVDMISGGYYLSDSGYDYIDALLNSELSINGPDNTYNQIINEMINANYDTETQEKWSDMKRQQIAQEYSDFLSDYAQEWRYTHVGLWSQTDNGIEIDMYYDSSLVDNSEQRVGGMIENGGEVQTVSGFASVSEGRDKYTAVEGEWSIVDNAEVTSGDIGEWNNIRISVNGVAYKVEVEGAIPDATADQINQAYLRQTGSEIPEKTVIKIGKDVYVRGGDNKIYRVDQREIVNIFQYEKLLEALN